MAENLKSPQSEVTDTSRQEAEKTRVMSAEPRRRNSHRGPVRQELEQEMALLLEVLPSTWHIRNSARSQLMWEPRKCSLQVSACCSRGWRQEQVKERTRHAGLDWHKRTGRGKESKRD